MNLKITLVFHIKKQLHHCNIVNLIDMFRRKGKLYLVFEYLDTTVLGKLDQYPFGLSYEKVIKYLYQLLKALEYCHSQNVC